MRAHSWQLIAPAILLLLSLQSAFADPWITAVTPRLIGRGTTSEIIIAPWRHEASALLFYPHATADAVPAAANTPATGIRCISTQFDPAKQQLTCQLEVSADCRPGEYPFRVLTAVGLSSMVMPHGIDNNFTFHSDCVCSKIFFTNSRA